MTIPTHIAEAVERLKSFAGVNGDIDLVCDYALSLIASQCAAEEGASAPLNLPTHEGWWWEWVQGTRYKGWYARLVRKDPASGDGFFHSSPGFLGDCQPGHWLPVQTPPPLTAGLGIVVGETTKEGE